MELDHDSPSDFTLDQEYRSQTPSTDPTVPSRKVYTRIIYQAVLDLRDAKRDVRLDAADFLLNPSRHLHFTRTLGLPDHFCPAAFEEKAPQKIRSEVEHFRQHPDLFSPQTATNSGTTLAQTA